MQGNGIFLLGSLDEACETPRNFSRVEKGLILSRPLSLPSTSSGTKPPYEKSISHKPTKDRLCWKHLPENQSFFNSSEVF